MKKVTLLFTLLTILGLLVACGINANNSAMLEQSEAGAQSDESQDAPQNRGGTPDGFEFEVPLQTALIIGSFELEGTENEITTDQAAELLPLWMVLKNLLESDTAATKEVDALTSQIADNMTETQMNQINTLELGPQSMREKMEELGIAEEFLRPEGEEGEESQRGANRPEGMPEGMGPGMGPGGGQGGEGLSPEQMEAFQATREAGGGGMRGGMGMMGNTALIDALIELLKSK